VSEGIVCAIKTEIVRLEYEISVMRAALDMMGRGDE
jgi:hypothetical protein